MKNVGTRNDTLNDLEFKNTPYNFIAGKTKKHRYNWYKLTNDKWIWDTIKGYKIELRNEPRQNTVPKPLKFSAEEQLKINNEIDRFLQCKIIEPVFGTDENEYISNIFIRPKKDGKVRVILNLKTFNENHMTNIHFKMETLQSAINNMWKNCYFGSVDISEAFYSVPIHKADRKYFRFWHNNQKYQFRVLIMGLTTSPRVFTKIMKPVFANLRALGHVSTAYIDDSCLQGNSFYSCLNNIKDTIQLMDSLGLTIHPDKSVLIPSQQIVFLGFILCSVTMTIRLTPEKVMETVTLCHSILEKKRVTIREFAQLLGKLVAAEPGVECAPLFYKPLEKVKDKNLKIHKGNYNSFMNISEALHTDINWWIQNLPKSFKHVSHGAPTTILFSDASKKGWGAYNQTEDKRAGGVWSPQEQRLHINVLELKACQLTLLSFCQTTKGQHVKMFMDNTTSCAYINKFGGKKNELNSLARDIWFWCLDKNIHLTAAHIPGTDNIEADKESRTFNEDLEWSISIEVFTRITKTFPGLSVDLFASRLNYKLPKFVTRRPEPNAFAIDAFSLTWSDEFYYMFPPFSLLPRILQKIEEDQTEAVLVAPIWPTQAWWPSLLHLVVGTAYSLPNPQKTLYLPHRPERKHPLKKMRLGLFLVSGQPSKKKVFRRGPEQSFLSHGGLEQNSSTIHTSKSGSHSVETELTPLTLP